MRRPLAILAVVFVACSSSAPAATISSSPGRSPSTTTPVATPNTPADLPVTGFDFACRLPVVTQTNDAGSVTFQGGFITFPAARLAVDPAGTIHWRQAEGDFATTATPILYGNGAAPFYDRARARWVPAGASQALADGSAYAYTSVPYLTNQFTAHIVDIATGSSRSFAVPPGWDPYVGDYTAAGVYFLTGSALGGPGQGVWLLDPRTGEIKELGHIQAAWAVRDGYAWVPRLDPRDTTVWYGTELAPANSLVRIDLATGAETVWFYRAGTYPWFDGLDSFGRPVITMAPNGTNEVRLIDEPGSPGQLVYSGNAQWSAPQGDGDRMWFGGQRGIYLYRPGRGLVKVFAYDPAGPTDRIEPAGFCL